MAHTKQTPRNPKTDRPTAAMGSDVQPERRVPSKPTSKKMVTKGGKQPQKHLLQKLIRQNKTSIGGIKKPHRYHPGLLALREICRYQQSTDCLIKRTPFNKLIREISQEYRVCPDGPGTHVITIKPPLQIVDIGNGCEAYSASIYIPAKSELTTTLQSITQSLFFLDYNFNYTNVSNFLIWHKTNFATLTPDEIKTLKAKMLKLPTMPMDIFKNVLGNIDENYPFSLSPKLILALLVLTGVCTTVIGILFIWYKRKTFFTSSTMGNLLKLIPFLKEKIHTLDSLLPILSELAPSQNIKNALTTVTVPQLSQTPPDELVLPPVLVPKLQMEKPQTTISVPYPTSPLEPLPSTSTNYKTELLSLEMFNRAATDLNEKGVINLKRYKKYLYQSSQK